MLTSEIMSLIKSHWDSCLPETDTRRDRSGASCSCQHLVPLAPGRRYHLLSSPSASPWWSSSSSSNHKSWPDNFFPLTRVVTGREVVALDGRPAPTLCNDGDLFGSNSLHDVLGLDVLLCSWHNIALLPPKFFLNDWNWSIFSPRFQ